MIDTTITLMNDGDDDFTITLPYIMHLDPNDLYDNRKEHKVVRFCVGSLDTTLDIRKELARLFAKAKRENFALVGARVLIQSGDSQLTMRECNVLSTKNKYGYFFEFEAERYQCRKEHIKHSHSPQT